MTIDMQQRVLRPGRPRRGNKMHPKLKEILKPAYRCVGFDGTCNPLMQWAPHLGTCREDSTERREIWKKSPWFWFWQNRGIPALIQAQENATLTLIPHLPSLGIVTFGPVVRGTKTCETHR